MTSTLKDNGKRMTAVVKGTEHGPGSVYVAEVPRHDPPAGYVEIEVGAAGVCGTDLHIELGEYASEGPVVMGHEVTGTVSRVGNPERDGDWLGHRVACETYFSTCGTCLYCRSGSANLCRNRRSIGSFEDGGFANFMILPTANLHELPGDVTTVAGVLCEPLACVCNCLLREPVVRAGDRVLVIGPGTMGMLSAQVCRACGGDVELVGTDRDVQRLEVARSLGLSAHADAPSRDDYDVVVECSGSGAGATLAFEVVAPRGHYVQVGIFGKDVSVPLDNVLYRELSIVSGFASTPVSWEQAMRLVRLGLVRLEPLVTSQVPVSDFRTAFDAVRAGTGLKNVIVPDPLP